MGALWRPALNAPSSGLFLSCPFPAPNRERTDRRRGMKVARRFQRREDALMYRPPDPRVPPQRDSAGEWRRAAGTEWKHSPAERTEDLARDDGNLPPAAPPACRDARPGFATDPQGLKLLALSHERVGGPYFLHYLNSIRSVRPVLLFLLC